MKSKLATIAFVVSSLLGCNDGIKNHFERGIIREEAFYPSTHPDSLDTYVALVESQRGFYQTFNFGREAKKIYDKYEIGNVVIIQRFGKQTHYEMVDF